MPKYSAERRLEVYRLFFEGYPEDRIVEEMARRGQPVSKGTVVNWVKDLKEGRVPQFEGLREQVEILREVAALLKKKRLTPSEVAVGLSSWIHLRELGVEPHELDAFITMCRQISPKDFPVDKFVDAAVRLHMLEVKLRKPYGDALNELKEALDENSRKLQELNSQIEALERKRASLENLLKELEAKHASTQARLNELLKGSEGLQKLGVEKVCRLSAFAKQCEKLGYNARILEELLRLVDDKAMLEKQIFTLRKKRESLRLEVNQVERGILAAIAEEKSLLAARGILKSRMISLACSCCGRPVTGWIPTVDSMKKGLVYTVTCYYCGYMNPIDIREILAIIGWTILRS